MAWLLVIPLNQCSVVFIPFSNLERQRRALDIVTHRVILLELDQHRRLQGDGVQEGGKERDAVVTLSHHS
jgi:hypothetical protein